MSKLVGYEGKTFTFDDGKTVNGFYLYTEDQRPSVTGVSCDRAFISQAKLDGYVPVLGDDIVINYNRWGKPQSITKR